MPKRSWGPLDDSNDGVEQRGAEERFHDDPVVTVIDEKVLDGDDPEMGASQHCSAR